MWLFLFVLLEFFRLSVKGEEGGDYFKTRQYINPGIPGPWVKSTEGSVWPMPKKMDYIGNAFYIIEKNQFEFKMANEDTEKCDIIVLAVSRFRKRFFPKSKNIAFFNETVSLKSIIRHQFKITFIYSIRISNQ